MNRGDIYMVSLDPVEWREQRGHRPVLIVSPAAILAEVMARVSVIFA